MAGVVEWLSRAVGQSRLLAAGRFGMGQVRFSLGLCSRCCPTAGHGVDAAEAKLWGQKACKARAMNTAIGVTQWRATIELESWLPVACCLLRAFLCFMLHLRSTFTPYIVRPTLAKPFSTSRITMVKAEGEVISVGWSSRSAVQHH